MHTLEPLCNLEQSLLLKELNFREEVTDFFIHYLGDWMEDEYEYKDDHNDKSYSCSRPTISMARNWLYEKYKLWMETTKKPFLIKMYSASCYLENAETIKVESENPHTAESECLTEILKHLKEKNDASKPL